MITERMQQLAGVVLCESEQKFLQDFMRQTWENPLSRRERGYKELVLFELREWEGMIHISSIRTIGEEKQGKATEAMKWVTKLADKHGVTLDLDAEPYGNTTISKSKLENFYKKFGFVKKGGSMIREPKS